eukprot:ANDGO_08590.mRNA.1 Protein IMPACT homolog
MCDADLQQEELAVLSSIYGNSLTGPDQDGRYNLELEEEGRDGMPLITMSVLFWFSPRYPSLHEPSVVLSVRGVPCEVERAVMSYADSLADTFDPGICVMYTWIELIRSRLFSYQTRSLASLSSSHLAHPTSTVLALGKVREEKNASSVSARIGARIIHGSPVTEKRSKFVAHVASIKSRGEYSDFIECLLLDPDIRGATHNISAYRVRTESGNMDEDRDDDGETGASQNLLFMMQTAGCEDVAVCITRWYGGVKLGSDRFRIITSCARRLLEQTGHIRSPSVGDVKKA